MQQPEVLSLSLGFILKSIPPPFTLQKFLGTGDKKYTLFLLLFMKHSKHTKVERKICEKQLQEILSFCFDFKNKISYIQLKPARPHSLFSLLTGNPIMNLVFIPMYIIIHQSRTICRTHRIILNIFKFYILYCNFFLLNLFS